MNPQVIRYSERPGLWESISDLSAEVWPEYNQHGQTINYYWTQLYDVFPDWQFVLYDSQDETVLAWPRSAAGRAAPASRSPYPAVCAATGPVRWAITATAVSSQATAM